MTSKRINPAPPYLGGRVPKKRRAAPAPVKPAPAPRYKRRDFRPED